MGCWAQSSTWTSWASQPRRRRRRSSPASPRGGKPEAAPPFPWPAAGSRAERVAPLAVPYPGAGPPLPRQLLAPPADFVGREEDLAHLREAAAAGGRVAIFGVRG